MWPFLFLAYYLPKDDEYYQFCYVDQDGLIRGASVPFQFRAEAEDDMLIVTTQVCEILCCEIFEAILATFSRVACFKHPIKFIERKPPSEEVPVQLN